MTGIRREARGEGPEAQALSADVRALRRLDAILAAAGLTAKIVVFGLFFWWATTSDTGAAALQGAIAADVLTWLVFSAVDWQFRGLQITAGAVFEVILMALFLLRHELFGTVGTPESTAMMFLFFMLFAAVKCAVWGIERSLEFAGINEPGSH